MDVDLNRAEAELQHEESALHTELSRLAEVSRELVTRLEALARKGQALDDPGLAARARARPPALDPDGAFASARAAREAAVRQRREVNGAIRQQLAGAKVQLQQLAQQVSADEQAVKRLEAEARARAMAPPPPPPPAHEPAPPPPPAVARPSAPVGSPQAKRGSPRVRMQATVDIHSDDNFYAGFSANISDGGLFVATVNLVPLGTEVELAFTLPSGARIETRGVVRWVREVNDKTPETFPGLGVEFQDLPPAARTSIDQFLAEREPLFYAE